MRDKPIGVCECEDCGKFPIMAPDFVTIFVANHEFFGVIRCTHCDRVLVEDMKKKTALQLFSHGVVVLNWNDGTEITDEKELERI